ncbi:MAG: hypothetical protein CBC65_010260 [Rhodothermaceae bacterium TMED105]|nr:MAG: hypothetical protein CBC65_010260 [Rhodothermaceae bacterium TMED105]
MKQTAAEHLDWCTSDESPQIDNIDIHYDHNGICSGVHTAKMADGSMFDVMFFGAIYPHSELFYEAIAKQSSFINSIT